MNRARNLIFVTFLSSAILSACTPPAHQESSYNSEQIRQISASLEAFGREELARAPETASRLGLKANEAYPSYINKIDDRSQAAFERTRLARLERYEAFSKIDITALSAPLATSLHVTQMALKSVIDMSAFGHGQTSLGFSRPFAADQLSGAYIDLPDLLINRQNIRSKTEALAYIERLAGMSDAIDDDRRRLRADANAGIIPPDSILARMIDLSQSLRTPPEGEPHPIIKAFSDLSIGAGDLTDKDRANMLALVERLVNEDIADAHIRLEATLATLGEQASQAPGIWAIQNGNAYYQAALTFYTGQELSPASLHEEGLQIVASISADLDIALQEAGFTEGTIATRLEALNQLPDQIFTNDEEGRQALLKSLYNRLRTSAPAFATLTSNRPDIGVTIAQVPDFLAANAPGGYYAAAPANGSAPGTFFINLRDTNEWPAYSLATLLYHETIPGHHLESTVAATRGNLPTVRQLIWLPVYGEGWALYAEDLANEAGLYADDPLGKVGYLQSLLFRAARLVTDTGIHYQRWSRERAIDYLIQTTGQPRSAMETEVDRYTVWPGQAVTYMVGRQFIWTLRQRSQDALGSKFSLSAFHDTILANGPRPLALVEADIDAWIASQLAAN